MGLSFKAFEDEAGRMLAKLLEIEYGEKASPTHLVMERSIPEGGTFFLLDKDGLMRVESGQTKLTLGEDFEKVIGKNDLEKLLSTLGSKKAALALVYVGEDNSVHSVWSQEPEFSFKYYPVKEGGIIGLHVVRVDDVEGVDLDGKAVRLTSATGGYELATKVEGVKDGEIHIPVDEPHIDVQSPRKYLKMMLPDGHLLGLRLEVDGSGKLNAKLAIYRVSEDTFRDLRLLKLIPELGEHYRGESDEGKKIMLRDILVGEYAEGEKMKPVFISMDEGIPREILDKLNKDPEHTMLEINAISFFKSMGESIIGMERKLEEVSGMITYRNYRRNDAGSGWNHSSRGV